MAKPSPFHRLIVDALRECIGAHGPIEKRFIGSAAKRIASRLEETIDDQVLWYRRRYEKALREIAKLEKENFRLGQAGSGEAA